MFPVRVVYEQRPETSESEPCEIPGKSVLGGDQGKYRGPKAGVPWHVLLRNRKEAGVDGAE